MREARGAAQLQRHIAVALDSDVAEQQLRRQLHLLLQHADAGADADANVGVGVAHPPGGGSATKERWSPFKNVSAPFTLPNAAAAVAVAGAGRAAAAAKAANDEAWAEAAVAEVGLDDEGGERGEGGEGGEGELEAAGLSAAAVEGLRVHSHPHVEEVRLHSHPYVERRGERPLASGDPSRLRTPRAPVYKDWSDAPHGRWTADSLEPTCMVYA